MTRNIRRLLALLIVACCGLLGWRVVRDLEKSMAKTPPSPEPAAVAKKRSARAARMARPPRRDQFQGGTTVEIFASSAPDEVILRFPSEESYEAFLFSLAGSRVHLVDQLDRLRAMRLNYGEWADLASLLRDENIEAYDSLPSVPPSGPGEISRKPGWWGSVTGSSHGSESPRTTRAGAPG